MFVLVVLSDTFKIPPNCFGNEVGAITQAIEEKYVNKVRLPHLSFGFVELHATIARLGGEGCWLGNCVV
jgi:DNA-directed RNA polymerase subunit E'/Rpb7